ncbi:MAG: 4-phosphopantetheinyl transferase family protein [Lachnospiraceae bacterium]|nr:4-phosphopantetheinyl transferase family protein [Lachnospiraceae bacterium]
MDVELVKGKDWRIFHRYLTDDEMSMIENSDGPVDCFFEVWTIREAFAKEEGLGLKILDRDFLVNYDRLEIDYDGRRLYFKSFDYDAGDKYKISVCSEYDVSKASIHILSPEEWDKLWSGLAISDKQETYVDG